MTTTETDIQRAIVDALKQSGFWVIRLQVIGRRGGPSSPGRTGEPGLPDLYLPGLGHLEVKHPQNTRGLSVEQVKWRDRASKHGVRVATVRSVHEAVKIAMEWRDEQSDLRVRAENGGADDYEADRQGATDEALQSLLVGPSEAGTQRNSHTDIRGAFRAATDVLSKKGAVK